MHLLVLIVPLLIDWSPPLLLVLVPVLMVLLIFPPLTSVLISSVLIANVTSVQALTSMNVLVVLKTMVMKCCSTNSATLLMKPVNLPKCITPNSLSVKPVMLKTVYNAL